MTEARLLGHYGAATLRGLFAEAGVLRILEERGFTDLEVAIDGTGSTVSHALLFGSKDGQRYQLIDAIVVEARIPPAALTPGGGLTHDLELAVIHWLRQEDPTRTFAVSRPALPLQRHPGLGILRRAFRVAVRMASELGKDGVGNLPKFFHDAVIFLHSRLFLFLDGEEQGRFEALVRDLHALPLGDASIALIGGCVRDAQGAVFQWRPGIQVFPISADLTAYFHAPEYAAAVARGRAAARFTYSAEELQQARALLRPLPC